MTVEVQSSELRARMAAGGPVFVLDVREPDGVAAHAFPGAHHIPLGEPADRTGELPLDGAIAAWSEHERGATG